MTVLVHLWIGFEACGCTTTGIVAAFLESRFLIEPTLALTLLNQDLMSPLLLFFCICCRRSSAVGSLRNASLLEVSLIAHISLAASSRGEMILITVFFHLLDLVQGFGCESSKSSPVYLVRITTYVFFIK